MTESPVAQPLRVGIIFSGGPAPAANAVISAAAISFLEAGHEVFGFFHGYSNLVDAEALAGGLQSGVHFQELQLKDVRGIRNRRGILLGTSRADPARGIRNVDDLDDPERNGGLVRLHAALRGLGLNAVVTIGGDGSLRISHLYGTWQERSGVPEAERVRLVHLPKTIDNDTPGIDFTFGFFTAVDVVAKEVENLRADAAATSSWFIVETMGRRAGWLSYGVAIAGEADMVLAAEDVDGSITLDGEDDGDLSMEALTTRIVDQVLASEARGKHHGVIVLAEGLAERLPSSFVSGAVRHGHGQIAHGTVDFSGLVSTSVTERYTQHTGRRKRFKSLQLGYESRCAPPHAFDVMLGSQLGIGAYRALMEENLDRFMVSVSGQLDLRYVPYSQLVDAHTGATRNRPIPHGGDLWRLARFLEARADRASDWTPGRRREPN